MSSASIAQRIIAHPPRPACCQPCDLVTIHFAGDEEIHVYANAASPDRLTRRLKRLLRDLVEFPSAVRAIAGETGALSTLSIVKAPENRR